MYLKRLELFGFKSFADKTRIELDPGITAIVGPNGSGKSNITDAIAWALGEQSLQKLRGQRMEDVIFSGSDGRKPLGLAEVVLTLDNSDGTLPLDFTEIMVGRRFYRGGEGEYLLNGVPCRLKDITELFLDTGVGKQAYSFIGQGQVEQVLNQKPDQHRTLFEEAAGINRYRYRKKEAQRKLEQTNERLLRVNDIISELETRLGPLEKEAKRAEHYSRLRAELRATETTLFFHQIESVLRRREELSSLVAGLQQQVTEKEAQAVSLEREVSSHREQMVDLVAHLASLDKLLHDVTLQEDKLETRLQVLEERKKALAGEMEKTKADQEARQGELAALEEEISRSEELLSRLDDRIAGDEGELARLEKDLKVLGQLLRREQEEVDQGKGNVIDVLGQIAEKRNEISGLESAGNRIRRSLEKLRKEKGLREAELASRSQQVAALQREAEQLQAALQEEKSRLAELAADKRKLLERLKEKEKLRKGLERKLSSLAAELQARRRMERGLGGYNSGVRAILKACEAGAEFSDGILGTVADLIQVPDKLEWAVEVALGPGLQFIVTETEGHAREAIEYLDRTASGRATFLPLDIIREPGVGDLRNKVTMVSGILGLAADLVHYDQPLRPAVAHLLGRVVVAEGLETAMRFARITGFRAKVVTLRGEMVHPGGRLTGGRRKEGVGGFLNRERERKNLEEKLAGYRRERDEVSRAITAVSSGLDQLERELDRRRSAVREMELRQARVSADLTSSRQEVHRLSREVDTLSSEEEGMVEELNDGAGRLHSLKRELQALEEERARIEGGVTSSNSSLERKKDQRDRLVEAATALKVELAALGQERQAIREKVSERKTSRAKVLEQLREGGERLERLRFAFRSVEDDLRAGEKDLQKARAKKNALVAQRGKLEDRHRVLELEVKQREGQVRRLRSKARFCADELREKQVELARLEIEEKHLREKLWNDYGLSFEELDSEAQEGADVQSLARRVRDLREGIRDLEPVNLGAVEEYREVRERYDFLTQQSADLRHAQKSLQEVIRGIDRQMKARFQETFDTIRGYFRQVFSDLFEGGQADLHLEDENDPLNSGIRISAQPPGKRLSTLSLLSGGERALTAIALLFAFLKVGSAPFCVLDEVDAPLDEVNNERFVRYLKKHFQNTQFLLITHQKRTMEAADALYGVIMEESGVSRLISVRLAEAS